VLAPEPLEEPEPLEDGLVLSVVAGGLVDPEPLDGEVVSEELLGDVAGLEEGVPLLEGVLVGFPRPLAPVEGELESLELELPWSMLLGLFGLDVVPEEAFGLVSDEPLPESRADAAGEIKALAVARATRLASVISKFLPFRPFISISLPIVRIALWTSMSSR
jgi:hypothetical protein